MGFSIREVYVISDNGLCTVDIQHGKTCYFMRPEHSQSFMSTNHYLWVFYILQIDDTFDRFYYHTKIHL